MIVDLTPAQPELLEQAAALLHARLTEGWPTLAAAREHVREMLDPARVVRGFVRGRQLLGWVDDDMIPYALDRHQRLYGPVADWTLGLAE